MAQRLFVYGSLRVGQAAHVRLEGAPFLGRARTAARYALVDLGGFPGLIDGEQAVEGELYEVTSELLARLDAYEGVPWMYARAQVVLEGGGQAIAYRLVPERSRDGPILSSGDWTRRPE